MAGNQTDNLLLLDLLTGLPRTPETGGTPDVLQLSTDVQLISGANLLVDGNLTVNGTTTTIHSEQVNIRDNHLYLNADYTALVAQTGGIVINVLPTATADTVAAGGFTAGVPATSNPTVITAGTATFAVGDIIQIAGANDQDNDGIFEVLSHVGTTLTIRGIGVTGATVPWVTNQFTTDATGGGDIRIVNVNVLEGDSSGDWFTATVTNTTGITYNTFTTQGLVDLQEAYEQGNTITTSAGEGNVTIAGTETLVVTTSGGLDLNTIFDFDGTSFDVQMTGTNGFSIDGTAASNVSVTGGDLTLSTLTSGAVNVLGANAVASVGGGVIINGGNGGGANSGGIVSLSGGASGAGATGDGGHVYLTGGTATSTNGAGGQIVLTTGGGTGTDPAGLVAITGPNDEDEPIVQITTLGVNGDSVQFFVGDSDPSGSVSGLAGSLFFRDTGTGAELYLNTSTNAGTTWTALSTAAGATLQSAYEAGNTITTSGAEGNITFTGTEDFVITLSDLLVDTTASISLDADTASNFTVNGGNLTLSTTTSGTLIIDAVALLDINAGANLDVDVTGTMDFLSTGAFSIDGTGNSNVTATSGDLVLSAVTTGLVLIDGVDGVEINSSAGSLQIGNDANTGAINIGTGAAARTITVGNATGATSVNFDAGTGAFTFDSTVGETVPLATLTTTGAAGDSVNLFVGDNSPNGTVTGLAGSVFFRDTGTTGELWLNTSAGSGTTWAQVVTGGTLTLQSAYEGGNTITTSGAEGDITFTGTEDFIVTLSDLLVDTTASISLDADTDSNFTVDTGNLTFSTTGSGVIDITSAEEINITFEANNNAAMVIDDGTNNFITFDSTTGNQAVEINQFLDLVGSGAGVTLTAGEAITAADVLTIEATTGDAVLADSDTGTTLDGLVVGVAAFSAANTTPVKVYTVGGSLIPVAFSAAPAAADNGRPVFISATPGRATLTAPTGSGNVVFVVGILQGADGVTTTPLVLFQPQFIAVRP